MRMRVTLIFLTQFVAVAALAQTAADGPATGGGQVSEPQGGQAGGALEAYARGDYASVVSVLEGPFKAGQASIQHRLILARAYVHLGRKDDALGVLKSVHADDRENGRPTA